MNGHDREFAVVEQLIQSGWPTAGVDALSLAIIKTERQMRRLLTHVAFQSAAFDRSDVAPLRKALASKRHLGFAEMRRGFEYLSGVEIATILGDKAKGYEAGVARVRRYRNKLFHGQLTEDSLTFGELASLARELAAWSHDIGEASNAHFGYEGFDRSYVKGDNIRLIERATGLLPDLGAYRTLLKRLEADDTRGVIVPAT
jgi:hypothetical protein